MGDGLPDAVVVPRGTITPPSHRVAVLDASWRRRVRRTAFHVEQMDPSVADAVSQRVWLTPWGPAPEGST